MDDNLPITNPPTTGQQSIVQDTQPVAPGMQPVPQPSQPGLEVPTQESPRITLVDLYGPSQPSMVQPSQPLQQEVSQPVEPQIISQVPVQQPQVVPPEPFVVPNPTVVVPAATSLPEEMPQQQAPAFVPSQQVAQESADIIQPIASPTHADDAMDTGGGFHLPSILKFVVGGIIVVLLLLVIWGVGSFIFSGKNSGDEKVNLTYWGLWENSSVMQPILDSFQKQHPNITITYIQQDPKDYVPRLLTHIQDGNGPDIFRLHNTWVYPLQSILLPLPSSVLDTKQLSTNYPPVVSQDMVKDGAVYGLPLQMDSLALFVNTDIFTHAGATVPTTWDNFITVAKALTVKDPNGHIQTAGAAIGSYDNIAHSPDIMSLLFLQNGANLHKLNGSQNATDALSFYASFARPDGNVWDTTLDNSLLAFSRGKAAMYFGYSYDIFAIKQANPSLNFATYPVPHLPGREMTVASYWVEGASSKSKHPKEALELLQYLAQKDTETNLYTQEAKQRSFGELYARTDLAAGLLANPLLKPFVSQFKNAASSIFAADSYYVEYNGALNQYLGNAINSMLKDTSADSADATLAQGVDQVVSLYAPKTK